MKKVLLIIGLAVFFLMILSWADIAAEKTIATGKQPQITADAKGIIRIVYGEGDKIYCTTSSDKGNSFSDAVMVAEVPSMHLGMARGPQLASSANYSVITAMDKSGNIHWFRLDHSTNQWKSMGNVNHENNSAPEGLMGLTADKNDHFYAVWLNLGSKKHSEIYFSDLSGQSDRWSVNKMLYQSPDLHVCECCKPGIAVRGSEVVVMFRNWLNGSRDLYVMKSLNNGKTFSPAEKIGRGTWKLNGCPMDGGGVLVNTATKIETAWQRKGTVYYCRQGQPEVSVGEGRTCSISEWKAQTVITYQAKDTLKLVTIKDMKTQIVGNGGFLKSAALPDDKIICVWEQDNKIKFKRI